jgi:hypothetical protein
MSKGSKPRPIDKDSYDSNFDKIFGKKPLTSVGEKKRGRPKKSQGTDTQTTEPVEDKKQ